MTLDVLEVVELAQRGRQLDPLVVEDGSQPPRLVGRRGHAEDDERLGDRLDAVDDVVEPRHELVDVLAVERA